MMPGDHVDLGPLMQSRDSSQKKDILFGHGLVRGSKSLFVSKAGVLRLDRKKSKLWIDNLQKRYASSIGDNILGVIKGQKFGEYWRVDIGESREALLSYLAFDGATKRTRPNFNVGDLVYARVLRSDIELGVEISCKAHEGLAPKSWTTGESVYGQLRGGYLFKCSSLLCRTLLKDDCIVLKELSGLVPFEVAVGDNGKVWVKSEEVLSTVMISNCILNSEHLDSAQTYKLVRSLASFFK